MSKASELTEEQKLAAAMVAALYPTFYSTTLRVDESCNRSVEAARALLDKIRKEF